MAKKLINTGSSPNDNTGDNLRTGGTKINDNFNEIYLALGDGSNLLNTDIRIPNKKFLFSNKVANIAELEDISPIQFAGCVVFVNSESSLYYAANGVWRELLTDTSDDVSNNYSDPLSRVAYTGNLIDLGINDGEEGQVLTTNGNRTFSFTDLSTNTTTLNGQPASFYLDFDNFNNLPTTIAGYGITDAFGGSFSNLTGLPTTIDGYGITDAVNTDDLSSVATSGSYNDLSDKPTSFTNLTVLGFVTGATISEFTTDTSLSGNSISAVPTESAVKTYVDNQVASSLTDLGISDGTNGQVLTTDGAGNFTFEDNVSSLTDLGISDGTNGQVLTTDGAGNFTFEDADSGDTIGNFTLASSTIDTDDSSAINITPSVIANSDLTVENDATINGLLTVSRLNVTGDIESGGTGTPELFSEDAILLTASTRVEVTQTPFKMASFTTAQRDTLTPENGDTIYNTTTNKFQGYAGGSWVDLH